MKVWEIFKKENEGKKYRGTLITETGFERSEIYIVHGMYLKDELGYDITRNLGIGSVLEMEFIEEIDWSKIPKDTKVLVSRDNENWNRRYFSHYKNGKIYCYRNGSTSWSSGVCNCIQQWEYCKLAEEE